MKSSHAGAGRNLAETLNAHIAIQRQSTSFGLALSAALIAIASNPSIMRAMRVAFTVGNLSKVSRRKGTSTVIILSTSPKI